MTGWCDALRRHSTRLCGPLAKETDLPQEECSGKLRKVLEAGNVAGLGEDKQVFAFRLHQWLSSGSSIYATLEPPDAREFRIGGTIQGRCGACPVSLGVLSRVRPGLLPGVPY